MQPLTASLAAISLLAHSMSVLLGASLRAYSRSRLEELCKRLGKPALVDRIAYWDDRTEHSADALAAFSGLAATAFFILSLGAVPQGVEAIEIILGLSVTVGLLHAGAAVTGRVLAEPILVRLWPIATTVRLLAVPITAPARWLGALIKLIASGRNRTARPVSVEVEVPAAEGEEPDAGDAEVSESTRRILENVLELSRKDVSEVMTPRSAMALLPESVSAAEAAREFRERGLSRIPLYGENRDDITGILYLKDLFAAATGRGGFESVEPRRLARSPYLVPDTKNAQDLLGDFRRRRSQIAIVLDEFGAVSGLVTLEDLVEELVGTIDDEHDSPTPEDPLAPLGDSRYEVDAMLPLDELSERIGRKLPGGEDFLTIAGLAFHELGDVPSVGASFTAAGVRFTVKEMEDHSIKKVEIDLSPPQEGASETVPPAPAPAARN